MKIAEMVYEKINPLFTGDIKLVEVEYVKKNDGMHLCVYIDKDTGVTIDDCVEVNHLIDEPLDELNPTKDEKYFLDVSSYGLDKPLKYDWQFNKYLMQKVDVKLYRKIDDKKEFTALLAGYDQNTIQFSLSDEKLIINRNDIAYITPYIEF